jgi:hypothetical protein
MGRELLPISPQYLRTRVETAMNDDCDPELVIEATFGWTS